MIAKSALVFGLLSIFSTAWSQDLCHFRRADIPRNESRLSELAGVQEFRCDYELSKYTQGTLLIAELYKNGKCVGRFRMSRAKYDNSKKDTTGVISIGWQRDAHNLVSVHDNGDFYSPWTASIHLEDFTPFDAYYFADSSPEKQKHEDKGTPDFDLYPVLGICGQRTSQIAYPNVGNTKSFLEACRAARAKDAIIIYAYYSEFDEEPGMKFTK
ncbi:MAG: hypothetical protein WCD79_02830 [Chthoniobacteraceae bacterium]